MAHGVAMPPDSMPPDWHRMIATLLVRILGVSFLSLVLTVLL